MEWTVRAGPPTTAVGLRGYGPSPAEALTDLHRRLEHLLLETGGGFLPLSDAARALVEDALMQTAAEMEARCAPAG